MEPLNIDEFELHEFGHLSFERGGGQIVNEMHPHVDRDYCPDSCRWHPVRGACVQTQTPLQANYDVIFGGSSSPYAHSVPLADFVFPPCYLVRASVVADDIAATPANYLEAISIEFKSKQLLLNHHSSPSCGVRRKVQRWPTAYEQEVACPRPPMSMVVPWDS